MHPHIYSPEAEVEVKQFSVCRPTKSVISGSEQAFSFTWLYLTLNISLERRFSVVFHENSCTDTAVRWEHTAGRGDEGKNCGCRHISEEKKTADSILNVPACVQTNLASHAPAAHTDPAALTAHTLDKDLGYEQSSLETGSCRSRVQYPHIHTSFLSFPCSLKAVLMGKPQDNTVDLSGIPLTLKDLERVTSYLQHSSEHIDTVELCFTELTDEMLLQLLPALCGLPHLTTLSLNGNRLTKAILRDLTETLKDPKKFPSVTWIDLGNNVDIFSLPQPFLVSLKRRCPKQGNLPTILEFGEGPLEAQRGAGRQLDPGGSQLVTPTQQMDRFHPQALHRTATFSHTNFRSC
uniref:Leucine rich repeat containing 75A n=1 Tax=Meleagris gallopavo TaxID=9103 RepID=A0A803XP87_MELGA